MSERGLPQQVLTEIGSPVRETRLTGVDELARIVIGADLAMAVAARTALKRLTEDDSRSVAASAVAALARTSLRLSPDHVDFGQVPPGTTQLVADVLVEGPPLALANATMTASGPGLAAVLSGRRLRVAWVPESYWLDGLVTVRGPAGWADVRVTGQVTEGVPMSQAAVEARLRASVVTEPSTQVVPRAQRRARRRVRGTVLIAGLTALVLLVGVGVAVALTRDDRNGRAPAAAIGPAPSAEPTAEPEPTPAAPAPTGLVRVPLAQSVRSLAKPAVLTTIKVGAEPEGVAVSPDGRTVWVANQSSHILSVVDTGSRRVSSVPLRSTPRFVTTSRDGRLVFVSMYNTDISGSGVAVVDAASRKVIRYLATGVQPYALAVGPDDRIWVPIHSEHRVEIYAAFDQRPAGRVDLPPNPHAVAFSANLMRAFTPNHESNEVGVIDMRTDKLIKTIPVSRSPHSVAVSPDGRTVLVAGYDAGTADLIDAGSLRHSGPFPVGKSPQSVAFATDGAHGYVVNEGDNTISVLNGHTGALTATIGVGHSPRTIAVSSDGRLAYVSNGDDDTVSVLKVGE